MKEYRFISDFLYNNNCYSMYLDNNNKHFFLKKIDDDLFYITIDELIDLSYIFSNLSHVLRASKGDRKVKFIPKVLVGGAAVTLTLSVFSIGLSLYNSNKRVKDFEKNYVSSENNVDNYVSYSTDDFKVNDYDVDTYIESDRLKFLYIYDMDYLDKALDYDSVSISDLNSVIDGNDMIPLKFKNFLKEYCGCVCNKYSDIDLRVFYENLKSLEVIECSKEELVNNSLSVDSYGCYLREENKIYVLDGYDYKKGTWGYQVLFHEFSHCLRTGVWANGETKVRVQCEGLNFNNTITAEALNSLFAVSLFDYEERDIAYQLQSNYHSIMIECMDNYNLSDYVNHSLSYYSKKLDEYNKDDNYSTVILELIQLQYEDYHNDSIKVDSSSYNPIYDYVSDMYFKKYISSDMSYDEAKNVCNNLVDRVIYDVPDDYNIDTNYFYELLKKYCLSIGIDVNVKHI